MSSLSASTDHRLLDACRNGDVDAFGIFYARHREPLLGFLVRRVGDPEAGVDLMAEAFATALEVTLDRSVQTGPSSTATDQLCFTNGEEITCGPAPSLSTTGVGGSTASATKGETTYTGLVPDGVSGVRFTPKDGKPVEVAVASNFYELVIPQIAPSRMMDAPAGFQGPSRIPAPPAPVAGTLLWLDSHGAVVGPQQPGR
jgi:hypothetical protein